MYYIAVFLFIVGGYWLYSGLRGSDLGLVQVAAITIVAAIGVTFVTMAAISTLHL
ncbi:MAG: hypothetical protein ABH826_02170 [Patescibacteria group bacterium]